MRSGTGRQYAFASIDFSGKPVRTLSGLSGTINEILPSDLYEPLGRIDAGGENFACCMNRAGKRTVLMTNPKKYMLKSSVLRYETRSGQFFQLDVPECL